jgi:glycyl-tRNA synthetase
VWTRLRPHFRTQYDDAQSIGRRYRRQDEIGTPLCVTVDFQTIEEDQAVTIRDRDSMEQIRVSIDDLRAQLEQRLGIA